MEWLGGEGGCESVCVVCIELNKCLNTDSSQPYLLCVRVCVSVCGYSRVKFAKLNDVET